MKKIICIPFLLLFLYNISLSQSINKIGLSATSSENTLSSSKVNIDVNIPTHFSIMGDTIFIKEPLATTKWFIKNSTQTETNTENIVYDVQTSYKVRGKENTYLGKVIISISETNNKIITEFDSWEGKYKITYLLDDLKIKK